MGLGWYNNKLYGGERNVNDIKSEKKSDKKMKFCTIKRYLQTRVC